MSLEIILSSSNDSPASQTQLITDQFDKLIIEPIQCEILKEVVRSFKADLIAQIGSHIFVSNNTYQSYISKLNGLGLTNMRLNKFSNTINDYTISMPNKYRVHYFQFAANVEEIIYKLSGILEKSMFHMYCEELKEAGIIKLR